MRMSCYLTLNWMKAYLSMAKQEFVNERPSRGILIGKYGHSGGLLGQWSLALIAVLSNSILTEFSNSQKENDRAGVCDRYHGRASFNENCKP